MVGAGFRVEVDTSAVQDALERVASKRFSEKRRKAMLSKVGAFHTRTMRKEQFGAYQGNAYANRLQTRTGQTRRQVGWEVNEQGSELAMFVDVPHARIQEEGGVIRPKRSKYLTVPLDSALTASGALSSRYKIRKQGSRYVTNAGPTFIFRSRKGSLLIGIRRNERQGPGLENNRGGLAFATGRGKNRSLKAFYVLKRKVTIKPRLGFRRTFEDRTKPYIQDQLGALARRYKTEFDRKGKGGSS